MNLIDRDVQNSAIIESYNKNLAALRTKLEQTLSSVGSRVTSDDRAEIADIVEYAANLALDCISQKARLFTFAIKENDGIRTYSRNEIEDRNLKNQNDDDTENIEGVVELYLSPGLRRLGDGRGGSLHGAPIVLSKAQVFMTAA
jgi:hypothetical protein